jgi:hypothetical protein
VSIDTVRPWRRGRCVTTRAATVVWVVGLLTAVPWATWYLLFEAPRESYALLIVGILFWIFGYWSLVGPVLLVVKGRSVMRALERARSAGEAITTLEGPVAREVATDFLAAETRMPRFVARRLYDLVLRRLIEHAQEARVGAPDSPGATSHTSQP